MKKSISFLLCLILILSLTMVASAQSEKVKLRVCIWDNEYAVIKATEAFNAQSDSIEVELIVTPWADYTDKLFTTVAGGDNVDAFYFRDQAPFYVYADKGMLAPLNDYIEAAGVDMSVYGSYADQCVVGDQVYAMPYRGGCNYLFYNKTEFDKAGLAYPDGTWKWADLREAAIKLTHGEGADKVYGMFFQPWTWLMIFPAMQEGVQIVTDDYTCDLDNDLVRKALTDYRNYAVEDKMMPSIEIVKAESMSIGNMFSTGKTAMTIAGEWYPGSLKKKIEDGTFKGEWGLTYVPCDAPEYVTQGLATKGAVNKNAAHPKEAFEYMSWITGAEGQKAIAQAGSMPAWLTDENKAILTESMGFDEATAKVFFGKVKMCHEVVNLSAAYVNEILDEEFTLFLVGSQDVDTTVTNCVTRINEAIEEAGLKG